MCERKTYAPHDLFPLAQEERADEIPFVVEKLEKRKAASHQEGLDESIY